MIDNAVSKRFLAVGLVVAVVGGASCARIEHPGAAAADGAAKPPPSSDASPDAVASGADAARDTPIELLPPPKPPCVNLQCQKVECAGAPPTSISGTTYAPNGKLPLYNVTVYVPNAALEPFPAGITCDRCGAVAS